MSRVRLLLITALLAGCTSFNSTTITVIEQPTAAVKAPEPVHTRTSVRILPCSPRPMHSEHTPKFPAIEVKRAVLSGDQRTYDALLFKHIKDLTNHIESIKKEQARYANDVRSCAKK